MNLLQLPIVDGGVQFGNTVVKIDSSVLTKTSAKLVTLGVRPENLAVSKSEGISVEVDVVEELGSDGFLYGSATVDGAHAELVSRVDGRDHPHKGETVFLKPEGGIMHLFDVVTGERLN
jgi:multiple sugar transport system ATP-binding protein